MNPAECDHQEYIGFREEIPYPIGDNSFGRATIDALGLAREILNERRRDRREYLLTFQRIVALAEAGHLPDTEEARDLNLLARRYITEAVLDSAEFAAMARAALL